MGIISDTEWCAFDYHGFGGKMPGIALSPNDSMAAIVLQAERRILTQSGKKQWFELETHWMLRWRAPSLNLNDFDFYGAFPSVYTGG